jgi:hypothetical protein
MIISKYKKTYGLLVSIFFFIGNLGVFGQSNDDQSLTFESFLKTNLIIESVIFTRESFLPSSSHNKQDNKLPEKEIFLARVSGADYLLSALKHNAEVGNYERSGVDAGRFNGTSWHDVNNTLVLSDSKNGQTDTQDPAIRASIGAVTKLGIIAFIGSDSYTYDKDNSRFELTNTNVLGGKALVQLNYSNGIVVAAIAKTETTNEMVNYVTYSYEPNFYNGRIPVEFSSSLEIGGTSIYSFTIRILQLSITNNTLPGNLIDPTLALNSKELKTLTSRNGSFFTQDGTRVLTTQERLEKKPNVTKHIIYIRTFFILTMVSSLLLPIIILVQQSNKKNKKKG